MRGSVAGTSFCGSRFDEARWSQSFCCVRDGCGSGGADVGVLPPLLAVAVLLVVALVAPGGGGVGEDVSERSPRFAGTERLRRE